MKRIVIALLAIALIGGLIAYKMYNKPHTDVASTEVKASLSATELFQRFVDDETLANEEFVEEVIQVSGLVSEVDKSNESEIQIALKTSDDQGFVRCGLEAVEGAKLGQYSEGDELTLVGICKGVLADDELDLLADTEVILSKCMIIE